MLSGSELSHLSMPVKPGAGPRSSSRNEAAEPGDGAAAAPIAMPSDTKKLRLEIEFMVGALVKAVRLEFVRARSVGLGVYPWFKPEAATRSEASQVVELAEIGRAHV